MKEENMTEPTNPSVEARHEREFPINDVLGVITGRLLGEIGGIYEVLNWMAGESVFTHQLPRISREARPVILARHPSLQEAIDEAEQVNPDNWEGWRDRWAKRYGPTVSIPKFDENSHERIDALSELSEMVNPNKIILVKT